MSIRLKANNDPRRLELGHGVVFIMRASTSIEQLAAESAAREEMRKIRDGLSTLQDLGMPGSQASLDDPIRTLGIGELLLSVQLAEMIVVEWEGVRTADDLPAPLSRRYLAAVLADPDLLRSFKEAAWRPLFEVVDEGKESGASADTLTLDGAGAATSPALEEA